jgi:NitT/TauT family transport system permease protein
MVSPSLEALRPVPPVALIPLSLLLLGFGVSMEAAVIAFACVWPILIATTAAVRASESRLYEVAQILELSAFSYARKFVLPAALGRIGVGMRIGLGIALVVAVTVEIVVNPRGLGYGLIMAQQSMRPDSMYAQLLWVGIIGSVLNLLLTQFDRRILRLYAGGSSR